jgi:hypothetical protein
MANLTDIINQDTGQAILRPDFSINPNASYDRKSFVKHAGDLFDLQEYSGKLREKTNDFDSLYDLINVLIKYAPGDAETNVNTWKHDTHEALKQANDFEGPGSVAMGKFVERRRESILNKLSAEQLYALFQRIPIYEGNKPQHKKIKTLRDKVYGMQKAAQEEQDPSQVVADEVRQLIEMASPDKKEFIMRNQKAMLASLNIAVIKSIQKEYSLLFKDANGKLNKNQIKEFLKDNYQIVEDFLDDEFSNKNNEEKADYWNDNLKPQYLQLANALYGPEEKAQKLVDNRAKEERKARAKALGLIV